METCIYSVAKYGYSAATVRRQHYGPLVWHHYGAKVTRQHGATLLIECSMAGDKTRHAHTVEDIIRYV
jgi:hypothetical protein